MKQSRGDFSANGRLLFLSLMAFLIGCLSTLIAKALLLMIALFTQIFYYGRFSFAPTTPSSEHWGLFSILVPVVGGLIIGLMAYFGSERIRGHGIPEALEAILFGKSIMQPKVAILKPLSSAISIGSGGPFGAEGPIIMTGGAAGSLVAQFFHLTAAERKTLLVAGAAAGMSAIFATPIASILLAVELLLFEWKPRSLAPVAIASATAALIRTYLLGGGPLFPVPPHLPMGNFVVLEAATVGVIAGAFSTIVSKTLYRLEDFFQKLPIHWMWWPALGGLVIGLGGYWQPRVLGVGYDVIGDFLSGHISLNTVPSLLIVKIVIWMVALASGTSGGVLAPLLIFGCALGTVESQWLLGSTSAATWSLVSMGAIMSGMMRSPFTAILFSFELTHDVEALLPLLVASLCAYMVTVLVMKRSILTEKIARRGYDIFREYGVDPLERLRVKEVMTVKPRVVSMETPLKDLINKTFGKNRHQGYPVVKTDTSGHQRLLGVIVISDLNKVSELEDRDSLTAWDLIERPPITVFPDDTCRFAAEKMAEYDIGRLPVIDPHDTQHLLGIVTRSDLLKARHLHFKEESERETIFSLPTRLLEKK